MTHLRPSRTLAVGLCLAAALTTFLFVQSKPLAQSTEEVSCQSMNYQTGHDPKGLTFDTIKGVVMEVRNSSGIFKTVVPKLLDGKPNPDLDRLFGLMMKGFPGQRIQTACFKGTAVAGAEVILTSVTLSPEPVASPNQPATTQRVQICDGTRCARVSDVGYLWTTN